MKRFQRYQEYKPSGIDWIEEVPKHWRSIKLKYLASINPTTSVNISNNLDLEFVPMENVDEKNGRIREYAFRPFDEIKNGYTPFQNDDVIFAKITPCMENGNCAIVQNLSNNIAFGSTEFIVFRSNELITKELLYYILRDKNTRKIFEINMTGSAGQKRVPTPFVANFKIPLPPLDEQKSIANFLDQKSKQIDKFIADKQALISLFEEQKKAIINDAVTKGLDKTAQLKPSGIEWLGEIPKNWVIIRLKYIGQAIIGLTYDPKEVTDENNGTLVLRSSNVQQGKIVYDDNVYVQTNIPEKLRTKKNDILICSRNGSRALIGKNAKIDNDSEGLTFGAFMTVFRSEFNDFMFYIFRSALFEFQSSSFLTSTVNQLTVGALNSFEVPFPPLEEQNQIVTYLETELAKIDTLIETAKAEITLIEEYKTSLINEAVTGKIKIHKEDVA